MIISLTGNTGVGKDTMADYMVAKYGFVKISMADPMKRIAKEMYDFSNEQLWGPSEARNQEDKRYRQLNGTYLTARVVTQLLGNEFSRSLYPETWIKYMQRVVKKIQTGFYYSEQKGAFLLPNKKSNYTGIIVSSCRFRNEIEAIKKMNGSTIRLKRPALSTESFKTTGIKNHLSETEQLSISDDFFTHVITVPEGIPNFYNVIDGFVKRALHKN